MFFLLLHSELSSIITCIEEKVVYLIFSVIEKVNQNFTTKHFRHQIDSYFYFQFHKRFGGGGLGWGGWEGWERL
jgi:hypothetical protein